MANNTKSTRAVAAAVAAPAAPKATQTVFLPLCKDAQGWFVAGNSPRGFYSEDEAAAIAEQATRNPSDRLVATVELPK